MATPQQPQQYAQPPAGYPMPQQPQQYAQPPPAGYPMQQPPTQQYVPPPPAGNPVNYPTVQQPQPQPQQANDVIDKIALMQGKNIKNIEKFTVSTGFSWIEPPATFIGEIFPSETTYHPLLNNTNYEIATNIFSVEGSDLPNDAKKMYKAKIQAIVEDSFYLKSLASSRVVYTLMIIFIIFLIITSSGIAQIVSAVAVLLLYALYRNLWVYPPNKVEGRTKWNEFTNRYNASQASGSTPQAILESFRIDDQQVAALQDKYNRAGIGQNASLVGSNENTILSALAGAALATAFKK